MSDATPSENLVNALLDGQLDSQQADRAIAEIAADPHLSELLAEFTIQRNAINELPSYRLNDKFADRVLEISALDLEAPVLINASPSSTVDWKRYAMSLAAIAALLMAMLVYQWSPNNSNDASLVARGEPTVPEDQPMGRELAPSVKPIAQARDGAGHDDFALTERADEATSAAAGFEPLTMARPAKPETSNNVTSTSKQTVKSSPAVQLESVAKKLSSPSNATPQATPNQSALKATSPGGEMNGAVVTGEDFAISGTAMASSQLAEPVNQTADTPAPAIDQVWILEVDPEFAQQQLLDSLVANSISIPAELQQSPSLLPERTGDNSIPDDGIYVMAKASQMQRALQQLSQSGTIAISAYQLPNQFSNESPRQRSKILLAESDNLAAQSQAVPATIVPPPRAIAQRLRGSRFESIASGPSSKIPETFDKLEAMMGAPFRESDSESHKPKTLAGEDIAVNESQTAKAYSNAVDTEEEVASDSQTQSNGIADPMATLFPQSEIESDDLKNFLILIRDQDATK